MNFQVIFQSPLGKIKVIHDTKFVSKVVLPGNEDDKTRKYPDKDFPQLVREMNAYLNGEPVSFSVQLDLGDLPEFTLRALKQLEQVPWGTTVSYKDLARQLKKTNAQRAIGQIMKRNPCPIILPCHRVISQNNSIGGFSGNIEVKRWLLNLEQITF